MSVWNPLNQRCNCASPCVNVSGIKMLTISFSICREEQKSPQHPDVGVWSCVQSDVVVHLVGVSLSDRALSREDVFNSLSTCQRDMSYYCTAQVLWWGSFIWKKEEEGEAFALLCRSARGDFIWKLICALQCFLDFFFHLLQKISSLCRRWTEQHTEPTETLELS